MWRLAAVVCVLTPAVTRANDMASMELAISLGDVIASENFCNLQYNQNTIQSFVQKRVSADDMQFTSTLSMMTSAKKQELTEMTGSAKAAHCAQITRVARYNGFIP